MSNMLSPLMIGLLVLVVILIGTFAGRTVRRLVPRDHLTEETKSLVSVSMEVVATISALLLGLLISNANNSFIADVCLGREIDRGTQHCTCPRLFDASGQAFSNSSV